MRTLRLLILVMGVNFVGGCSTIYSNFQCTDATINGDTLSLLIVGHKGTKLGPWHEGKAILFNGLAVGIGSIHLGGNSGNNLDIQGIRDVSKSATRVISL